ncbi:MAG TPA: PVC-type heme-binding CxxCH protein [Pirellulales bacterium]|nr:PVC-type heme-binding CxxCH protein [Pirellulales bacterium]
MWIVLLLAGITNMAVADEDRSLRVPHKDPAEALKAFHVRDGFRMELIAVEPLLADPVAAAYDADGRAWVVEMSDYPYTDKSTDAKNVERTGDAPLGKVRVLKDTDGDGVLDRSTLFADGLSWPTGIALFDGGAFVAGTPDLVYLKDTNGDGRADVRRTVFTGFRKLNVQAVINNLIWGLDGKVYAAGATNGGTLTTPEHPDRKAVSFSRADFRFDPRTWEIELISGGARFGNSFDDWGNRFICNIRSPVQHVVLPARYLARNPYLPVVSALHDVAIAGDTVEVYRTSPPEPWRVMHASRLVGEGDLRIPRSEKHQGYVTSAAGVTVYRGSAYPEAFRHQVFIGEVAGNLIHRQLMSPDGVTFTSRRIDEHSEFVTSDDNWFRPVNFVHAPDGTLHVLDMYRETIEHPWSIPDDIKARLDLQSGRDRGRMYRLAPPGFKAPKPVKLGRTADELVALLADPNAWHRETAQRLICERRDTDAVKPLRQLLRKSDQPLGRLHALWTLAGLILERDDLLVALKDKVAGVRRHAVLLTEPRLGDDRELFERVLTLADDPDVVVRFQVAFTLGELDDPRAAAALTAIARRDAADPWMRAAVLSSTLPHADAMLVELMSDAEFSDHEPGLDLVRDLAFVVGASAKASKIAELLTLLYRESPTRRAEPLRATVTLGLGEGARRKKGSFAEIVASAPAPTRAAFARLVADAARYARDPVESIAARQEAIRLISLADFATAQPMLAELLDPRYQYEVQQTAVAALGTYRNEAEMADLLLARWPTYTPSMRVEVVETLLARPERITKLLAAVAAGTVPASQINPTRRAMLLDYKDARIRDEARNILGAERVTPRAEAIAAYRPVLTMNGDALRGEQVFLRECSVCHRLGQRGHDVGPNLATILHRSPEQLLMNILDPNREVAPNFVQYSAVLDDGRVATGIIAGETPTSITLKRAENVQETILRKDIEQLASTGTSLMPEGIEKKIDPRTMADLLAFLLKSK